MADDGRPLFQQLADWLADGIVRGDYPEETALPSINEIAVFHQVNPATANRAVALLAERGYAAKRRGIGMFVTPGARAAVLAQRTSGFAEELVHPLVAEAKLLGLTVADVTALIEKEWTP